MNVRDLFLRNINDMHEAVAAVVTETISCSYRIADLCVYTRQGRNVHVRRVGLANTLKNEK
jgi:hypothetical protein